MSNKNNGLTVAFTAVCSVLITFAAVSFWYTQHPVETIVTIDNPYCIKF